MTLDDPDGLASSRTGAQGVWRQARREELRLPADGEVLVVLAELAAFVPEVAAWEDTLSSAERARAHRFVTAALRESFTTAHGLLRCVLGQCLGAPPGELSFGEGEHGKPFLLPPASSRAVSFNLSHSKRFVAVAVAARGELGVDVEEVTREVSPGLVDACTSPAERALFHDGLDDEARRRLFFRIWTRKEAVLKAAGVGIGVRLSSVDVQPGLSTATVPWGTGEGATSYEVTSWEGLPAGLSGALAQRQEGARPCTLVRLVPG